MAGLDSMRGRRDADLIYSTAYEWHNVMPVEDAYQLGRPARRINDALALLVRDGWITLTAFKGREMIRLTNPVAVFGWTTANH